MVRLNKYLAECGVCSRREADKLIEAGNVSVNGMIASAGHKVDTKDVVTLKNKVILKQDKKVILAYYKPQGVTCTEKDKYAEKTVTDALHYPVRVTYAGRLDKDSEGLLLMTNDGDLIQRLMRPNFYHEKEYQVKVKKEITPAFLEAMRQGVYLKELQRMTRACEVWQEGKFTFRIILTQGLNRQIRRMCMELSQEVVSLKRIRILNIELGVLKRGEYRELTETESIRLYALTANKEGKEI